MAKTQAPRSTAARQPAGASPGMLTDRYELTMYSSFVEDGSVDNHSVFEAFARRLPPGRRYGLLAGLGRLIPMIAGFGFTDDELAFLQATGAITARAADRLANFRFSGDITAYPEGETYVPGSPVLTAEGPLGECLLLETLVLSVLNHDIAVASAAARMVTAARGRPIIEMGSRRTHEQAAIAAARAAYLAGFDTTSNLAAGHLHGIPAVGTVAHAFILAHDSERDAFASQVAALGAGTTLLVDTFDIEQGIRTAVEVAGPELGGIRIDSGDLDVESRRARTLLDELGATKTRIVVTSDLDEYVITALGAAPIDGFGVGTRVVTGSGHPTAGMVYKLVAVSDRPGAEAPLRPVAKKASGKGSAGGRKTAYRLPDGSEHFRLDGVIPDGGRPVQVPVIRGGEMVHEPSLAEVRAHAAAALAALPPSAHEVADGEPYTTAMEEE
ncbi:nicotinate phosphoribosyltransferase [Nostocoides australiense]